MFAAYFCFIMLTSICIFCTAVLIYQVVKIDRSFIDKIYINATYAQPHDSCYIEFGWSDLDRCERGFINHKGDNSRNAEFNKKVFTLIGPKGKILDIGCGCGEAVSDFIDDGHFAVGIDGMKLWEKHKCGGWGKYPKNFFQADVGHFFYVKHCKTGWLKKTDNNIVFDLIMSWECLEHVKTGDIDKLMVNIDRHSNAGTYFIGSASIIEEGFVHRSLHGRGWWLSKFHTIGFEEDTWLKEYFGKDIIRDLGGLSEYFFLKKC